ncbi:MAG: Uma2 family endonuclease [Planctomycetota bacterium]|nr:Uma2 family endonuclease [Planctomycetota bacterium]
MGSLTLITAQDFEKIAAVLGPCELVKGEVVRMSPGAFEHSFISGNAAVLLGQYAKSSGTGRMLTNEAGFVVEQAPDTVRGADVAFLSYRRLPKGAKLQGFLTVAPELILEILASEGSWGKIEEKVQEYHRFGVDLVWVADPKTRSVRVYPKDGEPALKQRDDELNAPSLLPGFACRVSELFQD